MRLVGIDFGTQRIGLAISDPSGSIASPLATLDVRGSRNNRVGAILAAVRDYGEMGGFVVGLPLNMDDSEGPQAKLTRKFADELQKMTPLRVVLWDERLSSSAADELLSGSGLTHAKRKVRRDRLAAQIILQSYLDAHI